MQKILSIFLLASVWCLALPTVKPVTTRSLGSGVSINSQMVQSALTLQGQTLFVGQNEVLGRAERTAFQAVNPFAASASPKAQLETYHAEELFPGVTIATTVNCLQGVCAQEADGSMGALLMLGFEQIVGTGSSAATGTLQVYYRKQAVNSPKTDCDAELDLLGKLDKSEAEKYHLLGASDLSMAVCYSTEKKFLSLVTVSESGGVVTLTKEDISDCWSYGTLPSSSVALTGDGKWLYYPLSIANSCELYRLNLETKEAASTGIAIGSALVNTVQVAVSSNGKFLACNDTKKGTINIFKTSDMTGRPVAAIDFAAAGEVSGLVLSRTGKYLAFLGRKTSSSPWLPYRWKVRDGGEAEKVCAELTTDCGGLNLSPDGRYLAFVTQDSTLTQGAEGTFQVCLADFGLESADMIFTPKDGTIISQVAGSDNGQQLLFLAKENAAFEVLHLWSEESGMVEVITDYSVNTMDISGDGQRLAYSGLDLFAGGNVLKVATVTDSGLMIETPLSGTDYEANLTAPLAMSYDGQVLYCQDDGFSLLRVTWDADGAPQVLKVADATADFDALFCNYDGQILAFVEDNVLKVWTAEMDAPLSLDTLDGRDMAWQLLLDGCGFLRCTADGKLSVISTTTPGDTEQVGNLPADYSCLTFSANGHFALLKRLSDGVLCRLALAEPGAEPEPLADGQGQACELLDGATATLNASGDVVCFQDASGLKRLQLPSASQAPTLAGGDIFAQQERCVYEPLTTTPIPLWAQIWQDRAGLAVIPMLAEQPEAGQVALLPPLPSAEAAMRREWYSLRFTSDAEHFYGEARASLKLYDGSVLYNAELTFAVENVNDAPRWDNGESWTLVEPFAEGEATVVPLPAISDDDPDDQHTYTVSNVSELLGASLVSQSGQVSLRLWPDYAATARGEERGYEFTITVQDDGEPSLHADLQVSVRCQNTNQPPVMECGDLTRQETATGQMVFQWSDFQVSDGDAEDAELLRVVLTTTAGRKGVFHRRYGTAEEEPVSAAELANGLLQSDFPLLYVPDATVLNQVIWQACARDGEPSDSAKVNLTFLLARQGSDFGEVFGYHEPEPGEEHGTWDKLRKGWNVLSLPFALDGTSLQAFCQAVGAEGVWIWDNQASQFALTQELSAGQGFRVYLQNLPPDSFATMLCDIVLPPLEGALFTATPGWHLRGTVADGDFRGSRQPAFRLKCGVPVDMMEDAGEEWKAGTAAWLYFAEE